MGTQPDPTAAHTPAEFVATMRQLRTWADLSYRQLERKAADAGDVLPRATISGVLARADLPREELLAAFVRACGGDAATVDAWLDARRRLAISMEPADGTSTTAETDPSVPAPSDGAEAETSGPTPTSAEGEAEDAATAHPSATPAKPGGRSLRTRYLPMTLTGACAAAGVLALALWPNGKPITTQPPNTPSASTTTNPKNTAPPSPSPSAPSTSPSTRQQTTAAPAQQPTRTATKTPTPTPSSIPPSMPEAGWVRMHPASSASLCITEGRERNGRTDREIAVQRPCAEAPQPRVYLESLDNGIYRIKWHHPEFGWGCLGVDESLTEGSQLMSPGDCTDAPGLRYRVEPSGSGYRLRPMDSGLCIGILPPRTDGAEAVQAECTGASDQVFRFSPL
ncbi:RICIN domain-containing protein [Streptomyces sp. NPDC058914]|uniref:RICIN domain-containing protein n=1 Tax=Streptomyces sp. NPDC058914 TaxID=3346671 RepID=UPI003678C8AF